MRTRNGNGDSVLIVDDEPWSLRCLLDCLAEQGYRATLVSTAKDALRAVQQAPPDAVLLDLGVPLWSKEEYGAGTPELADHQVAATGGYGGEELLRRLRAAPSTASIPVIVYTIMQDPAAMSRILDQNTFYLTKDCPPADVSDAIRGLLHPDELVDPTYSVDVPRRTVHPHPSVRRRPR